MQTTARQPMPSTPAYPDTYLHVREERSGEEWIQPIADDEPLSLEHQIDRFLSEQMGGEIERDGSIMPRLAGDYYARIITDGRSPDTIICWEGGGFYTRSTY